MSGKHLAASIRVDRMVKILDRKNPGWHNVISLHSLRTGGMQNCVLGQLYGHFERGYKEVRGREFNMEEERDWAREHAIWPTDLTGDSNELDHAWVHRIKAKRAKAGQTH